MVQPASEWISTAESSGTATVYYELGENLNCFDEISQCLFTPRILVVNAFFIAALRQCPVDALSLKKNRPHSEI